MTKFRPTLVALGVVAVIACFCTGRAEAQFDLQKGSQGAQKLVEGGTSFAKSRLAMRQYEHLLQASVDPLANMTKLSNEVQKYKNLAKLGACLGVGFAVADAFGVFGPSADEKTMAAIKEVSGKIDRLEDVLVGRIDRLEDKILNEIQKVSARDQIRAHISYLSSLQVDVDLYIKLMHDENPDFVRINDQEKGLSTGTKPKEVFAAAYGIYEQVLGLNLATDLMESEYKASFGDMSRITNTNMMLVKMIQQAHTNWEMVSIMQLRRGNEDDLKVKFPNPDFEGRVKYNKNLTSKEINAIAANGLAKFGPLYEAIAARLDVYAKRGVAERTANVMKFMEYRFDGKANSTRRIPANWGSWDAEGRQSTTGFKKTDSELPGDSMSMLEQKYTPLAQELKDKYLCDWLVMAYHPMQRVSQNKYTGFANYNTWNWSGTNCIWFLENDPDLVTPSKLLFVLVQPYDAPPPAANVGLDTKPWAELLKASSLAKRPNRLTGFSQVDMDARNFNDGSVTFRGVDILHGLFGKETVSTPAGDRIETGLALQFRCGIPSPGEVVTGRASNSGSATFVNYGGAFFLKQVAGLIRSKDIPDPSGRVDPYGAFFLKTTTPTRLAVQQGIGRTIILHSSAAGQTAAPSVTPPPLPDSTQKPIFGEVTLKAGFKVHRKTLTAGGPMMTNLGGVSASVTKEPSYKLYYTAGKNPFTILSESKRNTTLLIHTPDGKWIAADSSRDRNAWLWFDNPQSGRYDIYVGAFGPPVYPAFLIIREGKE